MASKEFASDGNKKPCDCSHGSCSKLHTMPRCEQQATIYDWLRCEE